MPQNIYATIDGLMGLIIDNTNIVEYQYRTSMEKGISVVTGDISVLVEQHQIAHICIHLGRLTIGIPNRRPCNHDIELTYSDPAIFRKISDAITEAHDMLTLNTQFKIRTHLHNSNLHNP